MRSMLAVPGHGRVHKDTFNLSERDNSPKRVYIFGVLSAKEPRRPKLATLVEPTPKGFIGQWSDRCARART
jgi:hypothetical protein